MNRRTVSPAALRAMAVKNTKALEGREVPEGHIRSQAVEQYITEHTSKAAGGCTSRLGPAPDTEAAEAFHLQTDSGAGELLNVLVSEIWPLLEDSSPITKADQAQMLGGMLHPAQANTLSCSRF